MSNQAKQNIDTCDMYEFMSAHVGITVLHHGGKLATNDLLQSLAHEKGKEVLDVGCGKGLATIRIAQQYGCVVVGIDLSEEWIKEAKINAKRAGVSHLVSFRVGYACNLQFRDNSFYFVIAQAILVMVDDKDKEKVVREVHRILRAGGRSAWSELSWGKEPTQEFLISAAKETCSKGISNAKTFEGWEKLLLHGGAKDLQVKKVMFHVRGLLGMVSDEEMTNGIKVIMKFISDLRVRARMRRLNAFFDKYPEYLGYGIYIGNKEN
jgi:ubiquinone/menaquinone biosynthesis C-methylase UbiE